MSQQPAEEKVLDFLKLNAEPLPNGNLYICIGYKKIHRGCNDICCLRTVFNVIERLIEKGILIKDGDGKPNGCPLPNCYEIVMREN